MDTPYIHTVMSHADDTFPDDLPAPRQRCAFRCRPAGRGTASSMAHRFSRDVREVADDGWGTPAHCKCPGLWWQSAARNMPRRPRTARRHGWHSSGLIAPPPACIWETARSALCANDSPDIFF